VTPPTPETLIEAPKKKDFNPSPEEIKKGSETIASILANWDDKPEPKPLTEAEIKDREKLERLK